MKYTMCWLSKNNESKSIIRDLSDITSAKDLQTVLNEKATRAEFISSLEHDMCYRAHSIDWDQVALSALDVAIANNMGYSIKVGHVIISIPSSDDHRFYEIYIHHC